MKKNEITQNITNMYMYIYIYICIFDFIDFRK